MVSTPLAGPSGVSWRRIPQIAPSADWRSRLDGRYASEGLGTPAEGDRSTYRIPAAAISLELESIDSHAPAPSTTDDPLASPALNGLLEDLLSATRFALGVDTCAVLWNDAVVGAMVPRLISGAGLAEALPFGFLNPLPSSGVIEIEPSITERGATGCICPISESGALLAAWRGPQNLDTTAKSTIELAATLIAAALDQERAGTLDPASWRFLESALDATAEGIVARDAAGRLFHMNAAARDIFGIDPDASTDRLNDPTFLPALDLRDQWGQSLDPKMLPSARLRVGRPAPDLIVSARSATDGQRRWMLLHAVAVPDGAGRNAVVITVLRDFATIRRRDESHWLRASVTEHLRSRPIDMHAIEHDIAEFLGGGCAIVLTGKSEQPARPAPSTTFRTRGVQHPFGADEPAVELRLACGHLHRHDAVRGYANGVDEIQFPEHIVDIRIEGEGILHGYMSCRRSAAQACFSREELEFLTDLTEKIGLALSVSRLRESLDAGERLLIDIGHRLQDAEEAERRRVALSIHDGLAQVAASVCQQLEILAHRFAPSSDAESAELDRARTLAHRTVQEARMLIAGLRPVTLSERGLGPAVLEDVALMRADGWAIRLFDGLSAARFDNEVELEVYRVIQESLSNARKHAGRVEIDVLLEQRGAMLHFEVRDQGAGFDVDGAAHESTSSAHVGLGGMRERMARIGGTLAIQSVQGKGTCVVGDAPV